MQKQKSLNRKETKPPIIQIQPEMQDNKKSENCLKFTWLKTIFSSKYKDKRHKKITSGKVSRLGSYSKDGGTQNLGGKRMNLCEHKSVQVVSTAIHTEIHENQYLRFHNLDSKNEDFHITGPVSLRVRKNPMFAISNEAYLDLNFSWYSFKAIVLLFLDTNEPIHIRLD